MFFNQCQQALSDLDIQKKSLHRQTELGIMAMVDTAEELQMISAKEFKIKKKLVDKVHINSNGTPIAISVHASPTSSYPNGYVYTRTTEGRSIKAKDTQSLYIKLYGIYYGSDSEGLSIAKVFEKALAEKKATENPKDETIRRCRYEFKRYFNEAFQSKDISSISDSDLKKYTQNLVNSQIITKKRFLSYKGVLNLIFGYAYSNGIINTNPVNKIKNAIYLKSCDCSEPDSEEKILTQEEIQSLIDEAKQRADKGYYIYYYALRFSALTGVRIGELCSLKWSDIDFEKYTIHIHTQQLSVFKDGHYHYYEVGYTKNERGQSQGGRLFPLTDDISSLLKELTDILVKKNIQSEYVFCYANGEWMHTMSYKSFLGKLCRKHNLEATSNHALRRSLNSNILIPMGISVADRAKLLGHSVETNLKHYSYAQRNYVDNAKDVLNDAYSMIREQKNDKKEQRISIPFINEKSPQTLNL